MYGGLSSCLGCGYTCSPSIHLCSVEHRLESTKLLMHWKHMYTDESADLMLSHAQRCDGTGVAAHTCKPGKEGVNNTRGEVRDQVGEM